MNALHVSTSRALVAAPGAIVRLATGLVVIAMASCASVAVTSSSIEERTAFALGLNKSEITITHRRDDGVRTDYTVEVRGGARHNCYVTGTFSVTGRIVSDAICSPAKGAGTDNNAQPKQTTTPCNALLKAAGKC